MRMPDPTPDGAGRARPPTPCARGVGTASAVVQGFVGLSALAGSVGLVAGNLGLPDEMLERSPFRSWRLPGLVLGVGVGGSAMVAALAQLRRCPRAPELAIGAGAALTAWILVQVAMIGGWHWLQQLYLGLGLVEMALGVALLRARVGGG